MLFLKKLVHVKDKRFDVGFSVSVGYDDGNLFSDFAVFSGGVAAVFDVGLFD